MTLREYWKREFRAKRIVAFGNYEELRGADGTDLLPTLGTIQQVARDLNLDVRHYGYGVFGAIDGQGREWFGFMGGGAMDTCEAVRVDGRPASVTPITISAVPGARAKILRALRRACPAAWEKP